IEQMEPAGAGALMALLEERKRRLSAEGLFSDANKQLIPYMPRVIGVVTSPTGAVIRDIIHRISDRFPLHVLLWPVRVQGETCGPEVAAAVEGFNALDPALGLPRPDVIIVARGGGSLEDLWGFNDEIVVRAVAGSDIPVISAVGHETDWTLIDYAADVRAPTPTGAAEMAVPVKAELEATLAALAARLSVGLTRLFDRKRQSVMSAARALPSVDMLLALPRRRFDEAVTRLERGLSSGVDLKRLRFAQGAASRLSAQLLTRSLTERRQSLLQIEARSDRAVEALRLRKGQAFARLAGRVSPTALNANILHGRRALDALQTRSRRAQGGIITRVRERLNAVWRVAEGLSYSRVLERGFALVRDSDGNMVRGKTAIASGQHLQLQFADGHVDVVESSGGKPLKSKSAEPKSLESKPKPSDQGALF
ncbi:MAG: exodeoxyribonuclease VII large subunit, partial [Rhizobiaceae bacterium]